ncbi:MAG: hypothetical protein ACF8PN_12740 [Phycisphaerales bacterium]
MPAPAHAQLAVGERVRVTQQIPQRDDNWTTTVEGEVVSYRQAKTGSWFAHSKDDRLWLDRLELRLDDGEITICNLDQFSRVEIMDKPAPPAEPDDMHPDDGADETEANSNE